MEEVNAEAGVEVEVEPHLIDCRVIFSISKTVDAVYSKTKYAVGLVVFL